MQPDGFSVKIDRPSFERFLEQLEVVGLPVAVARDRLGFGSWEIVLDVVPGVRVLWDGRDEIASILVSNGQIDPVYGRPVEERVWDSANEDDAEPERVVPFVVAAVRGE